MSRRLTILVSWVAATSAATLLVAGGVGTIRDAARRDTALAAPTGSATIGLVTTTTPTVGSAPTSTAGAAAPATPTTSLFVPPSTSAAPGSAPASPPGTGPATNAPTTTSPAAPPPTTAPSTAPPTSGTVAPTTITIASTGGSVTLRSSPTSVVVVVTTPNAGFTAQVEQRGATAIRVEFESSSHKSRIEAWWDGGPRQDVRED